MSAPYQETNYPYERARSRCSIARRTGSRPLQVASMHHSTLFAEAYRTAGRNAPGPVECLITRADVLGSVVVRKNWISPLRKGFLASVYMAPWFTPHWTLALEVDTID